MGGAVPMGVGVALLGLAMVAAAGVAAAVVLFLVLLLLKPTRWEFRQLSNEELAARANYRNSALIWSILLGIIGFPMLCAFNMPYVQKELSRLYVPSSNRIALTTASAAAAELLIGVLVWRVIFALALFLKRKQLV